MALIHDNGVTLRRLDFSETSQVMVFFTREHGKVRAIGKGIKRSTKTRFAVGIDLLEVGEMVLSVRQPRQEALATLTEWQSRQAFAGLRRSLTQLYAGQYAAELTSELTGDWDPHPALYDGLVNLLAVLCEASAVLEPVVGFQRLLLEQVGFLPEFDVCVACRRAPAADGDLNFSALEGGLLCRDCEPGFVEKRVVDRQILGVVRGDGGKHGHASVDHGTRSDATAPGRAPPESVIRTAFELFNYHLTHLMGRESVLAAKLLPER